MTMITTPEAKLEKLNLDDDKWALVRTAQGSYLGHVDADEYVSGVHHVTLDHAFDYYSSLAGSPDGKVQKQTLCLPFETTLFACPITVTGSMTIAYLHHMDLTDRERCKKLVQQAHQMAIASRSNLSLDVRGPGGGR